MTFYSCFVDLFLVNCVNSVNFDAITEIRQKKNGALKKYDIVYLFNFQPPTACMYKLSNEPRNWERNEKIY